MVMPKPVQKTIGTVLRESREGKNLRLKDVADEVFLAMGYTSPVSALNYLSKVERGIISSPTRLRLTDGQRRGLAIYMQALGFEEDAGLTGIVRYNDPQFSYEPLVGPVAPKDEPVKRVGGKRGKDKIPRKKPGQSDSPEEGASQEERYVTPEAKYSSLKFRLEVAKKTPRSPHQLEERFGKGLGRTIAKEYGSILTFAKYFVGEFHLPDPENDGEVIMMTPDQIAVYITNVTKGYLSGEKGVFKPKTEQQQDNLRIITSELYPNIRDQAHQSLELLLKQ